MTIREYLESIGATQSELGAKVVKRMEEAMLADVDLSKFSADTALKALDSAADKLDSLNKTYAILREREERSEKSLDSAILRANDALNELKAQTAGICDVKINNAETKDAVAAYTATLRATKEIFSEENMTEKVMIAAINAGSYMAWRSIMGPKDNDEKPKVRVNARNLY